MAKYEDTSEIQEIPMDLGPMDEGEENIQDFMRDQGIDGPQSMNQGSGIMNTAEADMAKSEMAAVDAPIDPTVEIEMVVKEFIKEMGRRPESLQELKDFYNKKTKLNNESEEMRIMSDLMEKDKTKITLASGGLAGILGVK
tara:strand:- start:3011 stop:3433 length:423 start_codon:yes stop_codon:yes gene_type:complete